MATKYFSNIAIPKITVLPRYICHGVNRIQDFDFDIKHFYEYNTHVRQFHLELM